MAKTPPRRISQGVTFRKNPDRFIVTFKDAYMRMEIIDGGPEAVSWRYPRDATQYPMSTFGGWALSERDQNFVDAIMIAGVKKHAD